MKRLNEYLYDDIVEWLDDLKPQAMFLMGLPAAGKSTFLKNELHKHYNVKRFKVNNSDSQVEQLQYEESKKHYAQFLGLLGDNSDFEQYKRDIAYISNDGDIITHPITIDWFDGNKTHKDFYRDFYKPYYATFFYIRNAAKELNKNILKQKIQNISGGDALLFDGTGANPNKIFKQIKLVKNKGFNVNIIFLDTPVELCILRDAYRGKTQGRTVGKKIIYSYVTRIKESFNLYKQNSTDIDTIKHFKWIQEGNSPINGVWELVYSNNLGLNRKINNIKTDNLLK